MFNILFGLILEGIIIFFHNAPFIQSCELYAFDFMTRARANEAITRPVPLTLIDIDNQTWRNPKWGGGEPKYAPREQLYSLIEHAANSGARYIIVDILIEGPDNTEDQEFARKIDALLSSTQWKPEQHLIFVRSIRHALDTRAANEIRHSAALEQVIARHSKQAHLAAPYYQLSLDNITRNWELWKIACNTESIHGNGHWQILPSVQMLVAALQAKLDLSTSPLSNISQECAANTESGPEQLKKQQEAYNRLNEDMWHWFAPHSNMNGHGHSAEAIASRVIYRFNQTEGDAALYSNNPVINLRALDILNHKTSADKLNNTITVIGQTFPEAGDQHYTPLGQMSGSLVLLNSIDAMLLDTQNTRHTFNVLTPPNKAFTFFIVACLIIGVGYAFARWNSVSGTLIASAVTFALFVPASYYLFQYGVWLDFAVPLFGIQIHQIIKCIEEYFESTSHTKEPQHD